MTQTQAAILVLAPILAVSCLYSLARVRGLAVSVLAAMNILNVIGLQWWLGQYGLSAVASLAVLVGCVPVALAEWVRRTDR